MEPRRHKLIRLLFLVQFLLLAGLILSGGGQAVAEPGEAAGSAEIAPLDPLAMKLEPGQWREYRFTGGATAGSTVRWTWLETEASGDATLQWFETRMEQNGQLLVSRVLGNTDDPVAPPLRVIMQTGALPPREMPEEMRQVAATALKRNLLNPPVKQDRPETITVPAGEFETTVYESNVGGSRAKTYYSRELPGMIAYRDAAGGMELIAFGNDGVSGITGEIVPYTPLPRGVRPGVPRGGD